LPGKEIFPLKDMRFIQPAKRLSINSLFAPAPDSTSYDRDSIPERATGDFYSSDKIVVFISLYYLLSSLVFQ